MEDKNKKPRRTQTSEVLRYLQTHEYITQRIASDLFGAQRLAVLISTLRTRGYDIRTTMVSAKNQFGTVSNYAEYRLVN